MYYVYGYHSNQRPVISADNQGYVLELIESIIIFYVIALSCRNTNFADDVNKGCRLDMLFSDKQSITW